MALALTFAVITGGVLLAGDKPPPLQYVSGADSGQAVVQGTSTLHDWTVKGNVVNGSVEFAGEWKADSAPPINIQSIDLSIPVESLKSTEGKTMDNTMYDALKRKESPTITFKLTQGSFQRAPSEKDPAWHFDANGNLGVAGKTRPVGLDLAVTPNADGTLTINTAVGLKMTECGVDPPTALLGAVKAGDIITVKVTWQLKRAGK